LFYFEVKQIQDLMHVTDPLCNHEKAKFKLRIESWKKYRLEFLCYKPLTWKEHDEMEHSIPFLLKFGSIGRYGEQFVERYIQVVKKQAQASAQIVELDKNVRNTLIRSHMHSTPLPESDAFKTKIRKCRICKQKGFKNREPFCDCARKNYFLNVFFFQIFFSILFDHETLFFKLKN
jgi:hypothetical protein